MGILSIFGAKKHSLQSAEALRGAHDAHSHILFGVDDGIKTLEEALAVLAYEESHGVTDVWCTPHIMEDCANETEFLKARFGELCSAYTGTVRLHLAAEYMLDTVFEQRFKDRDLLTMDNETLLVETSTWTPPVGLNDTLRDIQRAGYRPLFAHPERYRYLNEVSYEELKRLGIGFQLNLSSLVGFYGSTAQSKAEWLLKNGFYTEIGSDCHRLRNIKEQYERQVLKKDVLEKLSALMTD